MDDLWLSYFYINVFIKKINDSHLFIQFYTVNIHCTSSMGQHYFKE